MAVVEIPHLCKDLAHLDSHGSIPSLEGVRDLHVEKQDRFLDPELAPHLVEDKEGGNLLGGFLHGKQVNHAVVQLFNLVLGALFTP